MALNQNLKELKQNKTNQSKSNQSKSSLQMTNSQLSDLSSINFSKDLRKIDLSSNLLTEKAIAPLQVCSQITFLNISSNEIAKIPSFFVQLTKLNVLNLSKNKLKKLKYLNGLSQLKALILNQNQIRKIKNIKGLTCLNTLVLSQNFIKDDQIKYLKNLRRLTKLSLSNNQLQEFPDFKTKKNEVLQLKELRLNSNKITQVPQQIAQFKNLQLLEIGNNQITDQRSIKNIAQLVRLRSLNLSGNKDQFDNLIDEKYLMELKNLKLDILNSKKFDKIYFEELQNEIQDVEIQKIQEQIKEKRKKQDSGVVKVKVQKKKRKINEDKAVVLQLPSDIQEVALWD